MIRKVLIPIRDYFPGVPCSIQFPNGIYFSNAGSPTESSPQQSLFKLDIPRRVIVHPKLGQIVHRRNVHLFYPQSGYTRVLFFNKSTTNDRLSLVAFIPKQKSKLPSLVFSNRKQESQHSVFLIPSIRQGFIFPSQNVAITVVSNILHPYIIYKVS